MKILIIDDNKLMLTAVSVFLKKMGYETVTSEDGFHALEIIQKEKFDLIIADILMPNISGLELLSLLKQFYFNSTPVILISSLNKQDIIAQGLDLGASEYITKPIDFGKLSVIIKKYDIANPISYN
jgi:DNA-binding response OmpR family regulator